MVQHIPFFETIANEEDGSPRAKIATAGLLLLRLIDQWVLVGMEMVEPEAIGVHSLRAAISALEPENPQRDVLFSMVNAMQTSQRVDLEPLFPRLNSYARLLEKDEWAKRLAADVDYTIARLTDVEAEVPDSRHLVDEIIRFILGSNAADEPKRRKPKKRKGK